MFGEFLEGVGTIPMLPAAALDSGNAIPLVGLVGVPSMIQGLEGECHKGLLDQHPLSWQCCFDKGCAM